MSSLKVSYKDPAELRRRDPNPRTHTPNQIKQIAASIKEFGFINPVLIDGSNGIIAGHGRVEAAKLHGMGDIPTVCAGHLAPAQVRATGYPFSTLTRPVKQPTRCVPRIAMVEDRGCFGGLDRLAEILRSAERYFLARLDLDRLAGGGVPSCAGGAFTHFKGSESGDAGTRPLLKVVAD